MPKKSLLYTIIGTAITGLASIAVAVIQTRATKPVTGISATFSSNTGVINNAQNSGTVSGNNNIIGNGNTSNVTNNFEFIVPNTDIVVGEFPDIQVLGSNIVNADTGYIKFLVSKEFLNSSFDSPITLKYRHGSYEPVQLTFRNDSTWGPAVTVISSERSSGADVFFGKCFRVEGSGKGTYTDDLQVDFYYSGQCVHFIPRKGKVKYGPPLNIEIGLGSNCQSYFPPENEDTGKECSAKFPALKDKFLSNSDPQKELAT